MDTHSARDQIGGDREERHLQIFNQRFAEIVAQAIVHAFAAHEADDGEHIVAKRIALDKGFANARLDFVIVPAHSCAGGDHCAH